MKKLFLVGTITALMLFGIVGFAYAGDGSGTTGANTGIIPAGGGPGPGACIISVSGDGFYKTNPGGTVTVKDLYASCYTVATVDWDGDGVADDTFEVGPMAEGTSTTLNVTVPWDIIDDDSYILNFDASESHLEVRIVVGNPPTKDVRLALNVAGRYWVTYADYAAGVLAVDYHVSNTGADSAYLVELGESQASNGVRQYYSYSPRTSVAYYMPPGSIRVATLKYMVPVGVYAFSTTNSATARDAGYNLVEFGSQPPSP